MLKLVVVLALAAFVAGLVKHYIFMNSKTAAFSKKNKRF